MDKLKDEKKTPAIVSFTDETTDEEATRHSLVSAIANLEHARTACDIAEMFLNTIAHKMGYILPMTDDTKPPPKK